MSRSGTLLREFTTLFDVCRLGKKCLFRLRLEVIGAILRHLSLVQVRANRLEHAKRSEHFGGPEKSSLGPTGVPAITELGPLPLPDAVPADVPGANKAAPAARTATPATSDATERRKGRKRQGREPAIRAGAAPSGEAIPTLPPPSSPPSTLPPPPPTLSLVFFNFARSTHSGVTYHPTPDAEGSAKTLAPETVPGEHQHGTSDSATGLPRQPDREWQAAARWLNLS